MYFPLFFQAEDGIRDFCLSRGLGDVYKRQEYTTDGLKIVASGKFFNTLPSPSSLPVSYTHLTLPTN